MARSAAAMLIAAMLVVGAADLGLTEWLGAHPFWAVKIGYIGVGIGVALAVVLSLLRMPFGVPLALGAALAMGGLAAARVGAARFAVSYAEDVLAGRFWFFGWIAAAAGAFLLLCGGIGLAVHRAK